METVRGLGDGHLEKPFVIVISQVWFVHDEQQ